MARLPGDLDPKRTAAIEGAIVAEVKLAEFWITGDQLLAAWRSDLDADLPTQDKGNEQPDLATK